MANQDKLLKLFAKRFEAYNTKVLEELAKVIKKFKGLNYSQASQLALQLKYDRSYMDLVDELAKLTKMTKKEIKKILEATVQEHIDFSETFFKARNMETPIYQKDLYLTELVNSVAKVSEGDFTNIAKSTGFTFLDNKNHIKFLNMQETYYKVIDDCVYAVSEGKDTFDNAMRKTIKQLADSGVKKIVYANEGKKQYTQRIDTAVRRNIQDSIRQISIETEKEFGKRFKADGVEIIPHSNPAPDHMYVQGHQFSINQYDEKDKLIKEGEFEKFQTDQDCYSYDGTFFPAESEETGRDRRSIGEYNCYHGVMSIILGVTKPMYTKEQLQEIIDKTNQKITIDGKVYNRYEATQLQRQIETEIRKMKDAHIMYKETNDREGMLEAQARITQLTRKYKKISKEADLVELLRQRTTVSGYRPIKKR